ncbi:PREDICTED: specifically androgen-regulated gene protein [Pygoscelis adeliae]|uniref:specifically androgen-regulated gene protein n=1 Tax=Pygoscelis adeliae TaxID=9238 RepID=UPI0004F503BD|nr:PREDICTED: specifically androgen-regulated gene protein [Pygoscelis adeliae]
MAACDMPRKELGLGMAGCNSGSCDSMVSTASNHSQRVKETIGSLDAEADSGVSTDETDYMEPSKLPGTWPKRDSVPQDLENGAPPPSVGQQQAAEQKRDPFQDNLVSHEWSRSNHSDAKRETAKETKTWTSWGQSEKSMLEEAPQDPDAKRGPPTAPKPRKLPPNIILKTSKNSPVTLTMEPGQKVKAPPPSSAGSQPGSASDTTAEKANSGHLDPKEREKARREALEKLGLPQDRREPNTHLQPTMHPQPREMAFPVPGDPEAHCRAAERSVPGIRQIGFKSNTLERSGVGLSSYVTSAKEQSIKTSSSLGKMSFIERLAPSFLRSSRPRTASLGAGKDFAGLKEPEQVEQEKSSKRRSHPLQSFPRPPHSCVSVKISPKGATDENRREALKKLGLLKE